MENLNRKFCDVILFDKRYYDKNVLDTKTNKQKLNIALKDKNNCKTYTFKEYEQELNSFCPKNEYVWTYFIS